jgi:hypothetical protein
MLDTTGISTFCGERKIASSLNIPENQKAYFKAKTDDGKLDFTLITESFVDALAGVAHVLTFGAKKYERSSWRTVPDAHQRYRAALLRHVLAMEQHGTWSLDPETKLPHISHAIANLMFLSELEPK